MRGFVLVVAVALSSLAACDEPPATSETACSNLCGCAQDPFQEHECSRQCASLLETFEVPQACLDCVADATCQLIEQDGCAPQCNAFIEELP